MFEIYGSVFGPVWHNSQANCPKFFISYGKHWSIYYDVTKEKKVPEVIQYDHDIIILKSSLASLRTRLFEIAHQVYQFLI